MQLVSLSAARAFGLKKYFTGVPCKHGHVTERWVNRSVCLGCHKEQQKRRYAETKDAKKLAVESWVKANPERVLATKARYRARNKEELKVRSKEYKKSKPHIACHNLALRNARKKKATPPWADLQKIAMFYKEAKDLTDLVGVIFSVDHIVPLKHRLVCGLHTHTNLRVIPLLDNIAKGNKFSVEVP